MIEALVKNEDRKFTETYIKLPENQKMIFRAVLTGMELQEELTATKNEVGSTADLR